MGLVLRTFDSREAGAMLLLFKTLILAILEYCCQTWSPISVGDIRVIEGVQRTFTNKIVGCSEFNYWERLDLLRLYSLERRRERYQVIYIWKILKGVVPNVVGLVGKH